MNVSYYPFKLHTCSAAQAQQCASADLIANCGISSFAACTELEMSRISASFIITSNYTIAWQLCG